MSDDAELLRRYAEEQSESAFAELVRRHVDLVYGAAWRRLGGDAHAAADVVQQVFTSLARQASALTRHTVLAAWLYAATRNVAIDRVRAERRRKAHEQEAHSMHERTANAATAAFDWERLRPALDDVMDELGARDREAVLLRYFARQPFAEIGRTLNLSEDAARMRVERSLEKLRALLARRGVTSTGAALGVLLADHAAMAAPAGLAASVTGGAVMSATGAGVFAGLIGFMSTSKLTIGIAGLAVFAVMGGALREIRARDRIAAAIVAAKLENEALARQLRTLEQPMVPLVRESVPVTARDPSVTQSPAQTEVDAYLARNPELRATLDRQVRANAAGRWVSFIRQRRLSPEQSERFLDLAVHHHSYMFSGPNDVKYQFRPSGDRGAARRELRALLGDEGFNDYIEFYNAGSEITRIPAQLASMLYFTPTPLTTEQADRLTGSLRHRQVRPDATSPKEIDWHAIVKDAAKILTEPQMTALMHLRVREEADGMLRTIR